MFLPIPASAPPDLSSFPASLPTQFEVAGVTQNLWFHLDDPVVLPTVKRQMITKK